jgi:hypothetical protein
MSARPYALRPTSPLRRPTAGGSEKVSTSAALTTDAVLEIPKFGVTTV